MEAHETNISNAQHLEKVRADIDSDQAKMDELKKRIKGRTILGFALPGTAALKDELHRTEQAWRLSVAEESSTMAESSHDLGVRAVNSAAESGGEIETDHTAATIEPRDPTE